MDIEEKKEVLRKVCRETFEGFRERTELKTECRDKYSFVFSIRGARASSDGSECLWSLI